MTTNDHTFAGPELRAIQRLAAATRLNGMLQTLTGAILAGVFGLLLVRLGQFALTSAVVLCVAGAAALSLVCGIWLLRTASTLRRLETTTNDHTALVMDAFARFATVYRTQVRVLLLVAAAGVVLGLVIGHA